MVNRGFQVTPRRPTPAVAATPAGCPADGAARSGTVSEPAPTSTERYSLRLIDHLMFTFL
jgi:hypothetical protein